MTRCSTHPNLPIVENPFGSSDHCHPTPGHEDKEAFHCDGAILNRCSACHQRETPNMTKRAKSYCFREIGEDLLCGETVNNIRRSGMAQCSECQMLDIRPSTTSLAHYDAATEALLHLTLQAPLDSEELSHITEATRCLDQAKQARLTEN